MLGLEFFGHALRLKMATLGVRVSACETAQLLPCNSYCRVVFPVAFLDPTQTAGEFDMRELQDH